MTYLWNLHIQDIRAFYPCYVDVVTLFKITKITSMSPGVLSSAMILIPAFCKR